MKGAMPVYAQVGVDCCDLSGRFECDAAPKQTGEPSRAGAARRGAETRHVRADSLRHVWEDIWGCEALEDFLTQVFIKTRALPRSF